MFALSVCGQVSQTDVCSWSTYWLWEGPWFHCLLPLHTTIILPVFKSHTSMIKRGNEVLALSRHRRIGLFLLLTVYKTNVLLLNHSLQAPSGSLKKYSSSLCQDLAAEENAVPSFSYPLTFTIESRSDFFFFFKVILVPSEPVLQLSLLYMQRNWPAACLLLLIPCVDLLKGP